MTSIRAKHLKVNRPYNDGPCADDIEARDNPALWDQFADFLEPPYREPELDPKDELIEARELDQLNERLRKRGFLAEEDYDEWLDECEAADAKREGRPGKRKGRTRVEREPKPVEGYARLPRKFCNQKQLLRPFAIGVLGATRMHVKLFGGEPVSKRALLKAAGAGWGSRQLDQLDAALKELQAPIDPIGVALLHVDESEAGLVLEVDDDWLPNADYVRVPWPVPKEQRACSLYLWLAARTPMPRDKRSFRLTELLDVLDQTGDHPKRDLINALEAVNAHRETLNRRPYKSKIEGDRVRFSLVAKGGVAKAVIRRRKSRKVAVNG